MRMLLVLALLFLPVTATVVHAEYSGGVHAPLGGPDPSSVNDNNHNGLKDIDADHNRFFDHLWDGLRSAWETIGGWLTSHPNAPPAGYSDDCLCVRG
jgi:hypothetical protein